MTIIVQMAHLQVGSCQFSFFSFPQTWLVDANIFVEFSWKESHMKQSLATLSTVEASATSEQHEALPVKVGARKKMDSAGGWWHDVTTIHARVFLFICFPILLYLLHFDSPSVTTRRIRKANLDLHETRRFPSASLGAAVWLRYNFDQSSK